MSILRDMERLFLHTEHRVVSAFPVIKCNQSSQARGRAKPPQPTGKTRVLCVTMQRRVGSRGFKTTLHVCKGQPGQYEIRKSFRLKLITRLEAFKPPAATAPLLEVTLMQRGFTGGEGKLAFEASSDAARAEIIGLLYTFCKSHERRSPYLVGMRRSELGEYADALDDDEEEEELASHATAEAAAASLNTPGEPAALRERGRPKDVSKFDTRLRGKSVVSVGAASSISVAESDPEAAWAERHNAQLAGVLDAVAAGATSLEEVRTRLAAERAAVEGANVHELLESAAAASRVESEIGTTLGFVDDLEDTLGMLDAKLRHMRTDMAVIEAWNNQLESSRGGNMRLLSALDGLASALTLAPGTETALRAPTWEKSPADMERAVAAAWDLHAHLQAITADSEADVPHLPSEKQASTSSSLGVYGRSSSFQLHPPKLFVSRQLRGMQVTSTRQRMMHDLQQEFLNRAAEHLSRELARVADASMTALSSTDKLRPPSHAVLHSRVAQLQSLLEVVIAMRPAAAAGLRGYYIKAVNALLKKEWSGAAKEALRQTGSTAGSAAQEPDLSLRSADSIRALERLHSLPARQLSETATPLARSQSSAHHATSSTPRESSSAAGAGLLLHEAFDILAGTFFPLWTTEVEQCLTLVCGGASESDAVGSPAVAALLSTLQDAVLYFLDAARAPKSLSCLSMAATAMHWQARLAPRPGAAAVRGILQQAEQKLRAGWQSYVADSAAAIAKFDGKSSIGGSSVRSVHVLPFTVNLEAVASRVEATVKDWARRDTAAAATSSLPPLPVVTFEGFAVRPSPFESTTDSFLAASMPSTSSKGPGAAARAMADAFYDRVGAAVLDAVESHAAADAKHGPRVRLENYSFLRLSLQAPALAQVPALQRLRKEAGSQRNAALAACTEQQIEILKLGRMLQLGKQLGELASSRVPPSEAAAALHCTAVEARQAVAAAALGLDKRLVTMRQKLQKHLGASSPYLVDVVWERTATRCCQAWEELERRLPVVFPGVEVVPSTEGLRTAFAAAKVASP